VAPLDVTLNFPEEILRENVAVLLAADVVYDDRVSEGLARLTRALVKPDQTLTCLFSVEKRYVFTVKDLAVRAPAFEHFLDALRVALGVNFSANVDEKSLAEASDVTGEARKVTGGLTKMEGAAATSHVHEGEGFDVVVSQISGHDVPQSFCYEKSPDLIILKLDIQMKKK
jgi:hypothetical protein